jgi:hypothetical protein
MKAEKINIEDLNEGDVVFLDKVYGYCTVLKTHIGVNLGTIVVFEATGIGWKGDENPVNKVVSKYYTRRSKRKLELYE